MGLNIKDREAAALARQPAAATDESGTSAVTVAVCESLARVRSRGGGCGGGAGR
jgi:hypothetical protein